LARTSVNGVRANIKPQSPFPPFYLYSFFFFPQNRGGTGPSSVLWGPLGIGERAGVWRAAKYFARGRSTSTSLSSVLSLLLPLQCITTTSYFPVQTDKLLHIQKQALPCAWARLRQQRLLGVDKKSLTQVLEDEARRRCEVNEGQ
jgi:hypothetical protein